MQGGRLAAIEQASCHAIGPPKEASEPPKPSERGSASAGGLGGQASENGHRGSRSSRWDLGLDAVDCRRRQRTLTTPTFHRAILPCTPPRGACCCPASSLLSNQSTSTRSPRSTSWCPCGWCQDLDF